MSGLCVGVGVRVPGVESARAIQQRPLAVGIAGQGPALGSEDRRGTGATCCRATVPTPARVVGLAPDEDRSMGLAVRVRIGMS